MDERTLIVSLLHAENAAESFSEQCHAVRQNIINFAQTMIAMTLI